MSETRVLAPRISTNDNYITIGEWIVKSGAKVNKDDELVSVETTKKTEVILADRDGYFFYNTEEGEDIAIGEVLGIITDDANYTFEKEESSLDEYTITKKAKELIIQNKVNITKFDKGTIIRERDVLKVLSGGISIKRSKANDIIIVGGGGLCKMIIEIIRMNKSYNIHGIIDTGLAVGTEILGVPVIGNDDDLLRFRNEGYMTAVNAIGSITSNNESRAFNLRKKIYKKIKAAGFFMPTLIHPSAQVAVSARLGEGVIVMENAVIGADAIVGDDALINTAAIVSHDCIIGNHCRISPAAVLAGNVKVGENALVGMGATLYIGINIGENAIISNGQNVFENVKEYGIVV